MGRFTSVRVRTLLALVCLTLSALMLLSVLTLVTLMRSRYRENLQAKNNDFHTTVTMIDEELYDYINITNRLSIMEELRPFNLSRDNPVSLIKAFKCLKTVKSLNQHIEDLCLYHAQDEYFITSNTVFEYDSFVSSYYTSQLIAPEELRTLFSKPITGVGVSKSMVVDVGALYTDTNAQLSQQTWLLLFDMPRWNPYGNATLGIFLNTKDFYRQLSIVANTGTVSVYDAHGNVLLCVGNPEMQYSTDMCTFSETLNSMGLRVLMHIPKAALTDSVLSFPWFLSVVLPLIVLITGSSLLLTRWVNRPMVQLMTRIGYNTTSPVNESAYISQYIMQLREDVSRQLRYTDELLIRKLLEGGGLNQQELTRCELLLKKDYAHCAVALLQGDRRNEHSLTLQSVVFPHALLTALPYSHEDMTTLILSSDMRETAVMCLTEYMMNDGGSGLTNVVAIGPEQDELTQLSVSFARAKARLNDMRSHGRVGMENADEYFDSHGEEALARAKHLKTCMHVGDWEAFKRDSQALYAYLCEQPRLQDARAAVREQLVALFPELSGSQPLSDVDFAFEMLNIVCACEPGCGTTEASQPDETTLRTDIEAEIDRHLEDRNFGLSTLAERYGLSDSAFSHMFKRLFKANFLYFVNQKKAQCAMRLLKESGLSLESIAQRLGYSSASNFSRMFKTYTGITPGAYRQLEAQAEHTLDDVQLA